MKQGGNAIRQEKEPVERERSKLQGTENKMTDITTSWKRWGEFGVKDSGLLIDNEWKKVFFFFSIL